MCDVRFSCVLDTPPPIPCGRYCGIEKILKNVSLTSLRLELDARKIETSPFDVFHTSPVAVPLITSTQKPGASENTGVLRGFLRLMSVSRAVALAICFAAGSLAASLCDWQGRSIYQGCAHSSVAGFIFGLRWFATDLNRQVCPRGLGFRSMYNRRPQILWRHLSRHHRQTRLYPTSWL